MFEPDLETDEALIDVAIETESAAENEAAAQLLERLDLERLVNSTLRAVQVEQAVTLTLAISGDSAIQALNREYRGQDKPTDVLSFPLLDEPLVQVRADWLWQVPEGTEDVEQASDESVGYAAPVFVTPAELRTNLGDIMISWPTTRRQAEEAGHSMADELLFLLCHGILHLVGYDDQTEAGYTEMVRLQKAILAGFEVEG
ncbi:MAG TPA: rRNA maturation RNase YbeY [Ktedonobacteraceae bacterium]